MGIWHLLLLLLLCSFRFCSCQTLNVTRLQQFVDELPQIPVLRAYQMEGKQVQKVNLTVGMYKINWKFHRSLPPTTVFAYGTSAKTASIPGPTIEARNGVPVDISWCNYLPEQHFLPVDNTLSIATPKHGGIPTVVHLHGGMNEPQSDGHGFAWFTANFQERGPTWTKRTYRYHNAQGPGNLWYHDHAIGLTRVNILAGLSGAYVIRDPAIEDSLNLPSGTEFDRVLLISDREFNKDGSIFMTRLGNNPEIHPQWQPEYFGPVILVNGKAWPYLRVQRRKYRFRIINSSNARFYQLHLSGSHQNSNSRIMFNQIGSDAFFLPETVRTNSILLAPSEIHDVIIDFSSASWHGQEVQLTNTAPYPYPSGTAVDEYNGRVMKFVVEPFKRPSVSGVQSSNSIPTALVPIQRLHKRNAMVVRHINLYEFQSAAGEPTHLYINAVPLSAPATETPRPGTTELWRVINLTEDNHPIHVHLAGFQVISERRVKAEELRDCLLSNDNALNGTCRLGRYLKRGYKTPDRNEAGWKNVYKMKPSVMTTLLMRFTDIHGKAYPFNATAEPGYVYHCHILDHEDNEMMRPLKLESSVS